MASNADLGRKGGEECVLGDYMVGDYMAYQPEFKTGCLSTQRQGCWTRKRRVASLIPLGNMKKTFVPRFFDTNQIDGVWEFVKAVSTKN